MNQLTESKTKQRNTNLRNARGQQMSHYALLMATVLAAAITMQRVVRRSVMNGLGSITDQTLGSSVFRASTNAVPAGTPVRLSFHVYGANFCEASGSPQWSGIVGAGQFDGSVIGEGTVTITEPTTFVISCDISYSADPDDRQVYSVTVSLILDSLVTATQSTDEFGLAGGNRATITTEHIEGNTSARDIRIEPLADFGPKHNDQAQ